MTQAALFVGANGSTTCRPCLAFWPFYSNSLYSRTIGNIDRHRGGGCPPTPATPPCVRVRTRRFESVTLAPLDQRRQSERFEVRVGEAHREGLGPGEVPEIG